MVQHIEWDELRIADNIDYIPPALLALTIFVCPSANLSINKPIPRWWGKATHHMFLKKVGQTSSHLSSYLHEGNHTPHPFTVSSLIGFQKQEDLFHQQSFGIRITTLSKNISETLIKLTSPEGLLSAGRMIELDYLKFLLCEIKIENQTQTYSDIWKIDSSNPYIRLNFLSPTGFNGGAKWRKFTPDPATVFKSLINRWKLFSDIPIPGEEIIEFITQHVTIHEKNTEIHQVPITHKTKIKGFTGTACYTIDLPNHELASWLHRLAIFSNYSGVGGKLSWGFGQCSYRLE